MEGNKFNKNGQVTNDRKGQLEVKHYSLRRSPLKIWNINTGGRKNERRSWFFYLIYCSKATAKHMVISPQASQWIELLWRNNKLGSQITKVVPVWLSSIVWVLSVKNLGD